MEYTNYVWDSKASEKGDDKPIKKNDHACDAQRYALFSHFFESSGKKMSEEEADNMQRVYAFRPY